jgi:hypothetical protein
VQKYIISTFERNIGSSVSVKIGRLEVEVLVVEVLLLAVKKNGGGSGSFLMSYF